MKPTDAFGDLLRLRRSIIETREAAVRLGVSVSRGGQLLMPELELPNGFQADKLEGWISRVARPRLRTLVSRGLARVLAAAARSSATWNTEPWDDPPSPRNDDRR